MSKYPEHDKLRAVQTQSQAIYDFLAWMREKHGAELAVWATEGIDRMWPLNKPEDQLLAQFFDIDLKKLDDEKRAMLDELRTANGGAS